MAKTTETTEILKVNRNDAVNILTTIGFKETRKYTNALLAIRLNKLKSFMEAWDGTLDGKTQEHVNKIIEAGPNGFVIVGEESKQAKKSGKDEKKPAKKNKTDGKAKKVVKGKKEKKKGNHLNRSAAAVLSMKKMGSGHTVKEIAERANKMLIESGEPDNIRETTYRTMWAVQALVAFGACQMDEKKVILVKS
jgi:hypothetical protein